MPSRLPWLVNPDSAYPYVRLKGFSVRRKVTGPYRSLVGVEPLRWKTGTGTYLGKRCWRNTKQEPDEKRTTSCPKSSIPLTIKTVDGNLCRGHQTGSTSRTLGWRSR